MSITETTAIQTFCRRVCCWKLADSLGRFPLDSMSTFSPLQRLNRLRLLNQVRKMCDANWKEKVYA